jgi:ribosomal protein L31
MVAEFKSFKGDHVTVNKIDALMETRIDRFNKRYNDVKGKLLS